MLSLACGPKINNFFLHKRTCDCLVVVGSCHQDRGGGEEATTPADAPPATHGGGTLQKLKSSSAAAAPAATSTSTGPRVMGQPTCKNDIKTGVLSTTLMMMTAAMTMTTTTGGAAEMPDGVGDEFESPFERDLVEFDPSGVAASPPVGIGIGRGWGESERQRWGWRIIAIPMGKKSKRA